MKILLATDGSDFAVQAAKECARIAATDENAVVRVLSVVETITPDEPLDPTGDYFASVVRAATSAASKSTEAARGVILRHPGNEDLKVDTKVETGKPEKLIVEEAEEWGADLIIIGSHGYGFWERTLLGSVSESVVHHAPCSVLIVKARG